MFLTPFFYLFIYFNKKMFLITFFFPLKFLIPFNSSLSSPTFISTHTNYYAFYFNIFFLSHLSLLSHQLSPWLSFLDFSNPKKTRERVKRGSWNYNKKYLFKENKLFKSSLVDFKKVGKRGRKEIYYDVWLGRLVEGKLMWPKCFLLWPS